MTAIYLLAALCVLVWLAAILLRGGLLAGSLLLLLAGTCFGYPFFHVDVKPIPLTSDRVLWGVLLAQCLVWRRFGWTEHQPLNRAEVALIALLFALGASTFLTDWKYNNSLPVSKLLFYYVMPAGLYWVARRIQFNESSTRWLLGSLAIFGLYLAITSVAEETKRFSLVLPRYIASQSEYPDFFGRGRGPLLNPAADGFLIAICLSCAALWWTRLGRQGKMLLLAAVGVYAAGVGCTMTRCAWIGAVLSLLIIIGLTVPKTARVPLIAGSLLLSLALAATQWDRIMAFKRDEGQSGQETAESVKLRPILAMVAWNMFREQPLFGCGFGQYRKHFVNVLADRTTELPLEKSRPYVQHNVFLGLSTETGLVGMGLFALVLAYWTRDAWRLWRSDAPLWARQHGLLFLATLGTYLPNAMFHDLAIIPMVNMYLFFLAGTVTAVRPLPQTMPQSGLFTAPHQPEA